MKPEATVVVLVNGGQVAIDILHRDPALFTQFLK